MRVPNNAYDNSRSRYDLKYSTPLHSTMILYSSMILPFPAFTDYTKSSELIANRIKGALFEQFYQYQESRDKMFTRVQI